MRTFLKVFEYFYTTSKLKQLVVFTTFRTIFLYASVNDASKRGVIPSLHVLSLYVYY